MAGMAQELNRSQLSGTPSLYFGFLFYNIVLSSCQEKSVSKSLRSGYERAR